MNENIRDRLASNILKNQPKPIPINREEATQMAEDILTEFDVFDRRQNWVATTASGTRWIYRQGILHIVSEDGFEHMFKPHVICPVDFEKRPKKYSGVAPWDFLNSLESRPFPEVGLSLYASGFSYWRLSTGVVSVEYLDEL